MGFDMTNQKGDDFRYNYSYWGEILCLARFCGWKPQGTKLVWKGIEDKNWDGTYESNDGQIVSTEDALALAKALESALPQLPDELIDEVPFKYYTGQSKNHLIEFIEFCRNGQFIIY